MDFKSIFSANFIIELDNNPQIINEQALFKRKRILKESDE